MTGYCYRWRRSVSKGLKTCRVVVQEVIDVKIVILLREEIPDDR